jgi:PAS domain-containing protein
MQAINEALYEWDIASGEMYYSPRLHQALGLTPEQLRTRIDWVSRIHPDDLLAYRRRQRHRVIDNRRPDESALLKTLGDQSHPAAVPIQALEMITTLAAEGQAGATAETR